jgi:prepilin-type N-terminal cleavage/methylation domain-containing protein
MKKSFRGIKKCSVKGMTLVETSVALVIFSTLVASFLPVFASYRMITIKNDVRLGATAVAQQVMDELRQTDIAALPASGNDLEQLPSGALTNSMPFKGKNYRVTITYCNPNTNCNGNTRRIRVRTYLTGTTNTDEPIFQLETVYTKLVQ